MATAAKNLPGLVEVILEVIVTSVEDAIAAEQGGATRLEVISHFEQDGLTPPAGVVEDILRAVRIPVRAMLRERNDFRLNNEAELDRLCDGARTLAHMGVDGLVLGFLRDGEVDIAAMQRILTCAPNCKATFHRAFEAARDANATLDAIRQMPQIDCILTSGGHGTWADRASALVALQQRCGSDINVLVGGGVTIEAIQAVCAVTPISAFHLGRAVREPQTVDGLVSAARVAGYAPASLNCPSPRAGNAPARAVDRRGC